MAKVGLSLARLYDEHQAHLLQGGQQAFQPTEPLMPVVRDMVAVDSVARDDVDALYRDLQSIGMQSPVRFGRLVSGSLPLTAIDDLAALSSLKFARPAWKKARAGSVTSQGDIAQRSDIARSLFGVIGSGIRVGVLSDSIDCAGTEIAADQSTGDLPLDLIVLDDSACPGIDEGRAMAQLVHDVAPGSSQAFHTAFGGQAGFAQGIIDLADAGSKVIVDDVIFFAEPMFQDGIVAQAVNTVKGRGVAYFSSAGNSARDAYEDSFRSSGIAGAFGGIRHDFDPGPGVNDLQSITLGVGTTVFVFQWDEPFFSVSGSPGSASDVDILLYDSTGNFTGFAGSDFNIGDDAVEVFGVTVSGGPVTFQIGLELFSGPAPNLVKYVAFGPITFNEFDTASGTLYGHANAKGAIAVGAAPYFDTPAFGQNPPLLESFSSAGPTPIFFDTAGNPLLEVRQRPQITGVDGGNTTFFGSDIEPDGFPNFFGTSASAPHAAGVAALMLQLDRMKTPDRIEKILRDTALDMESPGFDFDSGDGLIRADRALGGCFFKDHSLVIGDFDSDGLDELAGLTCDGRIFYTLNLVNWIQIPGKLHHLVVGDFDGNGADDLAGLTKDGLIFKTTNLSTLTQLPGFLRTLVSGDFNNDGLDDLAGTTKDGRIFVTTNMSTFTQLPGSLAQLTVGDFNNDGFDDLAGLSFDGRIFLTTNFVSWTQVPGTLKSLISWDGGGLGTRHLAGLAFDGRVFVTTNFATWVQIPGQLSKLTHGDYNQDGIDDLAGISDDGRIFCTFNNVNWVQLPGRLLRLAAVPNRPGQNRSQLGGTLADDLAGLASAGRIFATTDKTTWSQIAGTLCLN